MQTAGRPGEQRDSHRVVGAGDGADERAPAAVGMVAPAGPETSPAQRGVAHRLVRGTALVLGVCAAGLVLLVLGSTPAEARPTPGGSDPALSGVLRPAQDLLDGGLDDFSHIDVSTDISSLDDPSRIVESLNGSGPLQHGGARVIEDTVGTAQGVLGATADAPQTLLEVAGSATDRDEVAESQRSTVAPSDWMGAGAPPGSPAGAMGELSGDRDGTLASAVTSSSPGIHWPGAAHMTWPSATYGLGAPASPDQDPPSGAPGGPFGAAAAWQGSTAKASTHSGSPADSTGGNHQLTGTIPGDEALTPLALLFLAGQPRHPRRSPVFPPLVPPG